MFRKFLNLPNNRIITIFQEIKFLEILSQTNYANFTFTALRPFLPFSRLKTTLSPSLTSSTRPEICTNTSSLLASTVIKPNPLELLKNFTIPESILLKKH
ncbi:hypothetical protein EMA8858_04076 [Emticicia aquatica]|uniref:Uncharacterized protein n=1 Tax=Emticicia aquatica TaxID=1681835 RepID=A0ABM9AV66_9BACT|nr:hypothetical protein EMA8858_04076 [Emticicia aquatica]